MLCFEIRDERVVKRTWIKQSNLWRLREHPGAKYADSEVYFYCVCRRAPLLSEFKCFLSKLQLCSYISVSFNNQRIEELKPHTCCTYMKLHSIMFFHFIFSQIMCFTTSYTSNITVCSSDAMFAANTVDWSCSLSHAAHPASFM